MRRDDEIYVTGYEGSDQLTPADSLAGDLLAEPLDAGYSPPEFATPPMRRYASDREECEGETLDQRLAEEEPEVSEDDLDLVDQDDRAGRLVATGTGWGQDTGPAGWGASAEEAAMHVVED
ncbi:MAG: hypothetical protein EPN43_01550 [Jatrophihabitans sp.]|nr:MAG: hypothetical protein EPN43_01550 [Jatrophihabitans sp.]